MSIHVSKNKDLQLIIRFDYSEQRVQKIRSVPGRSWNQSGKYWTIPLTHVSVRKFYDLFVEEDIIKDQELTTFIDELLLEYKYKEQYDELLIKVEEGLKLKGYSRETLKSYLGHIRRFLLFIKKEHNLLNMEDINQYLMYLLDEKKKSHSYTNQAISSIRFLFIKILRKEMKMIDDIPRPKKEHKLPDVLSSEEVQRILNSVKNVKHRMVLLLTYSAGLRVSEVVRLKTSNIDEDRMLIHVIQAKGRKDRYTIPHPVVKTRFLKCKLSPFHFN